MTFDHLLGTPETINEAQAVLDQMACELGPPPKPAPTRTPAPERKVSPGERAAERLAGESLMERLHRELDLDAILERNGYTLVGTRGELHDFSAPAHEGHTHRTTITTAPSTDHAGRIGHSKSPSGALGKATYPNGFDALNALEALEGKTWRDLVPTRASKPVMPEYLTEADAQRRAADRERKRAVRCEEAAATRAEVEQRAAADDQLPPADRAVLAAMLEWAAERNSGSCWCGRAALAVRAGYSLGAVKRSVMHMEALGYFESTGKGGDPFSTAKRTFTRGSSFTSETIFEAKHDPRIDHDSVLDIESDRAGEGGASSNLARACEPWECWEAADDGHGTDELSVAWSLFAGLDDDELSALLDARDTVNPEPAAPVGSPLTSPHSLNCHQDADEQAERRELLTRVRQLAKAAAEPGWYLHEYDLWDTADLDSEAARLAALVERPPLAVRERKPDFADDDQPESATYDPAGDIGLVDVDQRQPQPGAPHEMQAWARVDIGPTPLRPADPDDQVVPLPASDQPAERGPRDPARIADPKLKERYYRLIGKAKNPASPGQGRALRNEAARLLNGAELLPAGGNGRAPDSPRLTSPPEGFGAGSARSGGTAAGGAPAPVQASLWARSEAAHG